MFCTQVYVARECFRGAAALVAVPPAITATLLTNMILTIGQMVMVGPTT